MVLIMFHLDTAPRFFMFFLFVLWEEHRTMSHLVGLALRSRFHLKSEAIVVFSRFADWETPCSYDGMNHPFFRIHREVEHMTTLLAYSVLGSETFIEEFSDEHETGSVPMVHVVEREKDVLMIIRICNIDILHPEVEGKLNQGESPH